MIKISQLKHLAFILKVKPQELDNVILNIDKFYYEWEEVKMDKSGKPRISIAGLPKKRVFNPSIGQLKTIQKRILNEILSKLQLPDYAYGAVRGRDNVSNAKKHQGKKFIFTTDLQNFFPSINHDRVFQMFCACNFSPTVARQLTQLTTYKGRLPQGAPTSPAIANLVFVKIGKSLEQFAKENKITFTSFVDDLTFSSPIDFKGMIPGIINAIESDGFKISPNKTNYKTKDPKVTGVPVKNNYLAVPRGIKRKIEKPQDKTPLQIRGLQLYADKILRTN